MDRVLDRLWIGAARDTDGATPLRTLGFSGVVVAGGLQPQLSSMVVHWMPNSDGDPWTKQEVDAALVFIHQQIASGRVLVACAAGMSRSASLVIGYLVRAGWDAPSAFALLKKARPRIAPLPTMLDSTLAGALGLASR